MAHQDAPIRWVGEVREPEAAEVYMALENYPKAEQLLEAMRVAGWRLQADQIETGVVEWLRSDLTGQSDTPFNVKIAPSDDEVAQVVFDAMAMQLFEDVFHLQRSQAALELLGGGRFELDLAGTFGLAGGEARLEELAQRATEFRVTLRQLVLDEPSPPTNTMRRRGMA